MERKQFVRLVMGTAVIAGFLLGWFVNKWFYLFVAFIGLNVLQSSFSDFCPMETVYDKYLA